MEDDADRKAAEEYLRKLQQRAFSDEVDRPMSIEATLRWIEADDGALEIIRAAIAPSQSLEETRANMRASIQEVELQSEFEDPFGYVVLETLVDRTQEAFARAGIVIGDRPLFGTVPAAGLDVMTTRVPFTSTNLVLVNKYFFPFCYFVSKLIIMMLPYRRISRSESSLVFDADKVKRRLRHQPWLLVLFAVLIASYAMTGRPFLMRRVPLRREVAGPIMEILTTIEVFTVGHELGHVISKHGGTTVATVAGDLTVEEIKYWHHQEKEADILGALAAFTDGLKRGTTFQLSGVGPIIALSAAGMVVDARSVLQTGVVSESASETHPPLMERLGVLNEAYERLNQPFPQSQQTAYRQARSEVAMIMDNVWSAIIPVLSGLRKAGYGGSISWS